MMIKKVDFPNTFEVDDGVYEAIDEFETEKHSEELSSEWKEKFDSDPASFFNDENLDKLQQESSSKRLILLATASLHITVTPDMAKKYFEKFPEDLRAVDELFTICRRGKPEDGLEFCLFSIAALEVEKVSKNFPYDSTKYVYSDKEFVKSNQYLEIAERRNLAPQILLENGSYYSPEDFNKFGELVADKYFEVLKEAGELNIRGNYFLEAERAFGEEFEALSDTEKAEFLRMALINIHHNMVAEEAYNSCFTRERVEDDKQRAINQIQKNGRTMHNVAHSMIFKTYQATSVYESKRGEFDYEMISTAERGGDIEEYADHRIVLVILDKMKIVTADKEKNIELLVDFWNKSRNPIFGNAVAEVLNVQDVNLSAAKLLELLKNETGDRNHISAILYRLEFGQIGISEKGVKYLEKMYDLGELNNPDYFVQRLTAKGDIGIFDDQRILQNYFNLGDLTNEERNATPQIHEFVYETLFRSKVGETEDERSEREKYLQEFKENYFGFYDDKFFEQTGIRFNNLDFREQGWFLICYKNADEIKQKKLIDFARRFGENGLISFLSLEFGQDMGDKILNIGEAFVDNPGIANSIFSKYVNIVNNAEETTTELCDLYQQATPGKLLDRNQLYITILKNAQDLLAEFSQELSNGADVDKIKGLLAELKNKNEEVDLLSTVLKMSSRNGDAVNFENIKNLQLEKKIISKHNDLLPAEKSELIKIAESNYRKIFADNPEAFERVMTDFKTELENLAGQVVYSMKYQNEIIAFSRFKRISDHEMQGGSLNVLKDVQGLSIGNYFINATQREISNQFDIKIKSRKSNPANGSYQKSGFLIVGEHFESDGVEYYDMVLRAKGELDKAA